MLDLNDKPCRLNFHYVFIFLKILSMKIQKIKLDRIICRNGAKNTQKNTRKTKRNGIHGIH
jgi:hypothetical protein